MTEEGRGDKYMFRGRERVKGEERERGERRREKERERTRKIPPSLLAAN
jgi:hypothetical protein